MEYEYENEFVSWLKFNDRIVHEAQRNYPILEQIKFLTIADSNLDEFIRTKFRPKNGLRKLISTQTDTIEDVYSLIVKNLENINIYIKNMTEVANDEDLLNQINEIFSKELFPLCQPLILSNTLPIPDMEDDAYFLVSKINSDNEISGIIQLPETRLIKLKSDDDKTILIKSDDIIEYFTNRFYQNREILWNKRFRVFRKIDSLSTEEDVDYLKAIDQGLKSRKVAEVIMVDVSDNIKGLESVLGDARKRRRKVPSGLGFLGQIKDLIDKDNNLSFPKAKPRVPTDLIGKNIFDIITKHDVLIHFPYESFKLSTVRFLEEAAMDPNVKVIKQTLYRVSHDSPIINALTLAAKQGKQVIVLMELKAKLDEEHNLKLVEVLKKAGCQIIFGPVQLKTHCKITLVIREEDEKLKKYINISTGNFNDITAKIYEDFSYFCKERNKYKIGEDICDLFNLLGGISDISNTNELVISPSMTRNVFENEIKYLIEAKNADPTIEARIRIKCNAFTDQKMAAFIYDASSVGVECDLIVRGMCIIKVGQDYSKNVFIKSVIGRYLEHSRIYEFSIVKNGVTIKKNMWIGSGDMMERNLDYRIEAFAPIRNKQIMDFLSDTLDMYIADESCSYIMQNDGTYLFPKEDGLSIQNKLIEIYYAREKLLMK